MKCSIAWCDAVPESDSDKCDWHLLLELERRFRPVIADLIEEGLKRQGVLL